MTKIFGIPDGKKSYKVRMPTIVRLLPPKKRIPLIAGVMDTDWVKCGENKFGSHYAHIGFSRILEIH